MMQSNRFALNAIQQRSKSMMVNLYQKQSKFVPLNNQPVRKYSTNFFNTKPRYTQQQRNFSGEALRPNAEPYDPYKNQPITTPKPPQQQPITSNTTTQTTIASEQVPFTEATPPLPTEPIRSEPIMQQNAIRYSSSADSYPPPPQKPHFFKRNPWILPQVLVTTPLLGVIVYQQLLINEIVAHTQAVEQAVEQFGDIIEYHHNVLGQIVEFPDGGYDEPYQSNNRNSPPPNSQRTNSPQSPFSQQPPPVPSQTQQQPGGRQPYQPRSNLFPDQNATPPMSPQQQQQQRDTQRVPPGYPFNQ